MINIPAALFTKYSILLNKKSVPVSVHNNYKKWFKNASKELIWQFFFPAKTLTLVPESGEYRDILSTRRMCRRRSGQRSGRRRS